MTRAMGQRVVAEGVETEVQRDWLREQGCDLAQGWLYGKAELPADLGAWIHRAAGRPRYGSTISTTLPRPCPVSTAACAAATSASG